MSRVVGIDLGTTNSCVALMDGDQGIVIEGGRVTEAGPLVGLSYFRTMAGDADAVA